MYSPAYPPQGVAPGDDQTFPDGLGGNRPTDDDGTFKLSRAKSASTTNKKKRKCCGGKK